MALRLELQKTVSHRIGSAAVSDLSGCYKLIVFDLFDACDCQGTYNAPPHSTPNIVSTQEKGVIMYVYVIAREIQTVRSLSLSGLCMYPFSGLQCALWQDCMLACLCVCAA